MCKCRPLGRTLVVPGNGSQFLRGVFTLEPEADLATASAFLETPHPGITLTYEQALKAYLASDLSDPAITPSLPDGILDAYRPCTIDPIHGYSLVYEVELPHDATSDDQLSIQMCSEGGYDQVRLCLASAHWPRLPKGLVFDRPVMCNDVVHACIVYKCRACSCARACVGESAMFAGAAGV